MRIGLITTLNTNIGDDLIREGICRILRRVFNGYEVEFILVNKHQPLTVYPNWHPIHSARITRYLPRGRYLISHLIERPLSRLGFSKFDSCDLIIQCGTPVVWPGCSQCEWAESLWHQIVGRLSRKGIPVLNLGAGSCYPWERQPQQVSNERDAFYLRKILSYCRITTVRDKLAQRLFENLGYHCPLIPCPALLIGKPFINDKLDNEGFVVVNYMEKGGHYDWGQNIDPALWRNTMKTLIKRMRKNHQVLFLCHNQKEYRSVFEIDPTIPRFLPKNSQEYLSMISRAKVGLCNRLHAAIALASVGVPSLAVGTDTRLFMVEVVGLPYLYVKEATVEKIENILQYLLIRRREERERLLMLCKKTWDQYIKVVKKALCL